jgi:hypothetical protein
MLAGDGLPALVEEHLLLLLMSTPQMLAGERPTPLAETRPSRAHRRYSPAKGLVLIASAPQMLTGEGLHPLQSTEAPPPRGYVANPRRRRRSATSQLAAQLHAAREKTDSVDSDKDKVTRCGWGLRACDGKKCRFLIGRDPFILPRPNLCKYKLT